jgi:hypothetical protein
MVQDRRAMTQLLIDGLILIAIYLVPTLILMRALGHR